MSLTTSKRTTGKTALAKERLRLRYRPVRVRMLFIGEAPPASGRFFYQADSGLYRAVRDSFSRVFPDIDDLGFLTLFRALGCYLVDVCDRPVDRLTLKERRIVCVSGEVRLARTLRQLSPEIVVTVVRSIGDNVRRSERIASWRGLHIELPYPGRWHHHRTEFVRELAILVRKTYRQPSTLELDLHRMRTKKETIS
jgi:hypothetical protein